jgi:hypothetical protein
MHPSARDFALRAAAKVAMSMSAIGCGGMVEAARPDPVPEEDTSPRADVASTDVAVDVAPEIVVATSCSDTTGRSGFACCIAEVESAIAADAGVKGDACCPAIVDFLESENGTPSWGDDYGEASKNSALQFCCSELKAWTKSSCTPWGPPAPPAMEIV